MRVVLYDNQIEILIRLLGKIKNSNINKETTIEDIVDMSDAAGVLAVIKFQLKKTQEQERK